MSDRLVSVVTWVLTLFLTVAGALLLASAIVTTLAPTFWPKSDISGFRECLNTCTILLAFCSLGMGAVSIHQGSQSGKQSLKILQGLQTVAKRQDQIVRSVEALKNIAKENMNIGATPQVPPAGQEDDVQS